MSKLSIKGNEIYIEPTAPSIVSLVDIKELKNRDKDEPTGGMVRVYVHHSPNGLTLQLRAKTSLTDRSQPKNLIATTRISIEQLREVVDFFDNRRREPRFLLYLRPSQEYIRPDKIRKGRVFKSNDLAILVRFMHRAISKVRTTPWMIAWLTETMPDGEVRQIMVIIDDQKFKKVEERDLQPVCRNCRHWRDKAWTGGENNKGIGICDNPLVDVRPRAKALLASQGVEDWAATEILESVRFPDDFGCRFYEPILKNIS